METRLYIAKSILSDATAYVILAMGLLIDPAVQQQLVALGLSAAVVSKIAIGAGLLSRLYLAKRPVGLTLPGTTSAVEVKALPPPPPKE